MILNPDDTKKGFDGPLTFALRVSECDVSFLKERLPGDFRHKGTVATKHILHTTAVTFGANDCLLQTTRHIVCPGQKE